jgi:glycosyltransferase involved in cell wall biosynthesis
MAGCVNAGCGADQHADADQPSRAHNADELLVSVIVPVRDGAEFLLAALASALAQTHRPLEVCVRDDGSTDDTVRILHEWVASLNDGTTPTYTPADAAPSTCGITVRVSVRVDGEPCGPGPARNTAVAMSTGSWLCFLDADDVMHPTRIAEQLEAAIVAPSAIVGCGFVRDPPGSTPRQVRHGLRLQIAHTRTRTTDKHLSRPSAFALYHPCDDRAFCLIRRCVRLSLCRIHFWGVQRAHYCATLDVVVVRSPRTHKVHGMVQRADRRPAAYSTLPRAHCRAANVVHVESGL